MRQHVPSEDRTNARLPLIIIGAVLLFIGGIFVGIGGNTLLDERRYQHDGQRVPGIVTDKTLRRATTSQNTAYEISFRFSAGSREADGVDSVPVHVWERLERSSPVEIEYLPAGPDPARIVRDRSSEGRSALVALAIGAPLMIAGLLFAGAAFRRRRPAPEPDPSDTEPATFSPAAPQSVLRLALQSSGFLAGAIFLVVGSPFLVAGLALFHTDWQFANEAKVTHGMVLTKSIRTSGKGSKTKHYQVTYRFWMGGETFEGNDEVSWAVWDPLVEREPVDVFYRPAKPSSNQLEEESRWGAKILFTLLGGIFSGIGGTLFGRSLRHAALELRLRQTGIRTTGNVTSSAPLNLEINSVVQWRLEYEYQDFQGGRHVGTLDLPEPEALCWQIGDSGTVLYDSSQPTVAIWAGHDGPET
jgi:Protein of unknown function (DUF3592)